MIGLKKLLSKILYQIPFKFGIDENGNYGYYKEGADTVTPFSCYYIIPENTIKSGLKNAVFVTGQYDNSFGFYCNGTVSGVSLNSYCGTAFELDVTNYDTLYFAYRKSVDHGQLTARVYDSDKTTILKSVTNSYHTNGTDWGLQKIDLSQLTGRKWILLHGGYIDSTGSASSQSYFSNIYVSWGGTPQPR